MAEGYQIGCQPKNISAANDDRPAIHVALMSGLGDNYFSWVAVGAEEEGVPCRLVTAQSSDPIEMAYQAAMSSRFGVGVGVSTNTVVVHELHMPPHQPVITFESPAEFLNYCRLAGSNAARLIIRLPLRFELEAEMPVIKPKRTQAAQPKSNPTNPKPESTDLDPVLIKAIAKVVARIVQERGKL